MLEEDKETNDVERRLRAYFQAEDQDLETPLGLWDRLLPRLGEQRRHGWSARAPTISWLRPAWTTISLSMTLGAWSSRKALAAAMVLLLAVGAVYWGVTLSQSSEKTETALAPMTDIRNYRALPDQTVPDLADNPPAAEHADAKAPTASLVPGALQISVDGDNLRFDQSEFPDVSTGTEVVVVFNNVSGVNQHNWVLVQSGTKDSVAQRGVTAGPDNGWLQPGDTNVIASTDLLGPGETGEARFIAPAPGIYQFVCSFPGHSSTMFGDFVVSR